MKTSTLTWKNAPSDGVLWLPEGSPPRAGVVALPGASDGSRDQRLFRDLAAIVGRLGVAVLTYDRRAPIVLGADTSLEVQAADAAAACAALEASIGAPTGLFGFSQGAWAAVLATGRRRTPFLVTLGCSGVTPAEQMRFYCAEQLGRRGFDEQDVEDLRRLRLTVEHALRGRRSFAEAARAVSIAATRPWFEHAYLPGDLSPDRRWEDMDHDPRPGMAAVRSPVLAVYGADEECVPAIASAQAWEEASSLGGFELSVVTLAGCGHWPVEGSGRPDFDLEAHEHTVAETYDHAITSWLGTLLDQSRAPVEGQPGR